MPIDKGPQPVPTLEERALRQITNCRNLLRDFDIDALLNEQRRRIANIVMVDPAFFSEHPEHLPAVSYTVSLLEAAKLFADTIDAAQASATLQAQKTRTTSHAQDQAQEAQTQEDQQAGPSGTGAQAYGDQSSEQDEAPAG